MMAGVYLADESQLDNRIYLCDPDADLSAWLMSQHLTMVDYRSYNSSEVKRLTTRGQEQNKKNILAALCKTWGL